MSKKTTTSTNNEQGGSEKAVTYTKEQLIKSSWYSHRRDLLAALLTDGKSYSIDEADKLINNFMKGRVN